MQTATVTETIDPANPLVPIIVVIPQPVVGVPYSFQYPQPEGGVPPYAFGKVGDIVLPDGLSLSPTGLISGTPTTAGPITSKFTESDSTAN